MARLVLHLDGQTLAEYNMSKERYTIGRLPDNDIRIDNAAVSGHHALVINILNDSFLEDLNSTNGTYVNGKIVKKHALQHGDVITVGHHALRFVDGETEEEQDEFEKTMVISSRDAAQLVAGAEKVAAAAAAASAGGNGHAVAAAPAAAASGGAAAFANGVLPRAKLQVLSGQFAGRELDLVKTLTTLGRPGVQVAAITRRADGFYIVHVESGRENDFPLVNGAAIGQQARRLHDNDVVQLAGVKMGFFES
jgi:pSer/pThr/pTyr-binding forkhead associated (FHA) protein